MRRFSLTLAAALTTAVLAATPAQAIVGGEAASSGEYPSVARITLGESFLCTGTLVAPDWVMTAAHCSSLVPYANVQSLANWPPELIRVEIGGTKYDTGRDATDGEPAPVERVYTSPDYIGLDLRHDVALLKLSRNSGKTPTQVAGVTERAAWEPRDRATIAGWGVTEEDGDTSPRVLQEAQVPITTDAYAADAYDGFDHTTMIAAGYPKGGVDSCQGDSGGPLFVATGDALRVVGATSHGEGCARPGKPGVYARVADRTLRAWIAKVAPSAIATDDASSTADAGSTTRSSTKRTEKRRSTRKQESRRSARDQQRRRSAREPRSARRERAAR